MSAGRRALQTEVPGPRAAVVILAHRRDPDGVPWARAPIADGDALETVLGTARSADLEPIVVVIGPDDPRPLQASLIVVAPPDATDDVAIAAARAELASRRSPPSQRVLVIPVEQPLASGTLMWTLVATAEAHAGVTVAAAHEGHAGYPRVVPITAGPQGAPHLVEAGPLATFWTAASPSALDEVTRERARALLAAGAVQVRRLGAPDAPAEPDLLAAEEPLEIRLGEEPLAVLMRTPGHDVELALGFLLTEAVVRSAAEVRGIRIEGNVAIVDADPEVAARATARRSFVASSACGVCGKSSIDEVVLTFPRVASGFSVTAAVLSSLPGALATSQAVFARTGGLHAAALFDATGRLHVIREDVGRHNAVDKVVGWAASKGALPLSERGLLVSGRIGFEIAQKATAAGIPLIAAVGAPSSLAASLAAQSGVTLVGFLREGRGNVYTHPQRVG